MKKATSKKTSSHRDAARELAAQYRIVLTPHGGKGFVGASVELPMVLGAGKTEAECVSDTRDAIVGAVRYLLESGKEPPSPASEGKREVQLNIRLTAHERMRIEERARAAGFRSIADYMRRAALRAAI
jgi:predicted RNase H-like HicB family nuclease